MSVKPQYLTAPVADKRMPGGVPYILGNEVAERFSFYGMRSILILFMTAALRDAQGDLAVMSDEEAKSWFHWFVGAAYFTPFLGALLADMFFGKFRTIIALSIIYCLGLAALVVDNTRVGLFLGLALVAIGSGAIKSCVSANVGDQFGKTNRFLMEKVYLWFYFAINTGSFVSFLLVPWARDEFGVRIAFAIPCATMFLATIIFWMGRWQFVHIPVNQKKFVRESFSREGLMAVLKLSVIYLFIIIFWSLYDQTSSAWVLQARHMDRVMFGFELTPDQLQAVNPLLIMIMIPLFSYVIYPAIDKVFKLTPLRKIGLGLLVTVVSFAIPAWLEARINAGETPTIYWQVLAYVIITAGEVMVSITCLEFSYTQAPKAMKSIIMAVFFLTIALGNTFTALVNMFIQNPDGTTKLDGPAYYWFFAILMLITTILFAIVASFYKEKSYIHDEAPTKDMTREQAVEATLQD